jgi:O-antigen/teichoic acid export membrane protein
MWRRTIEQLAAGDAMRRRLLLNTGALLASNGWRIGISFVLQLLIARQLGVEALGAYTAALAYLNVCQVLSELGAPALLVRDLAQRPTQRHGYFALALQLQLTAAFATWVGLFVLTAWLPFAESTRNALWWIGASLPFYAITSVTQTLFQAGERMDLVMAVEVVVNTLIFLVSVGVLWLGGGLIPLVAVWLATQAISAGLGWWLLQHTQLLGSSQEPVHLKLATLRRQAAPFWRLSLADTLLQRLDILLLSVVAGETTTGVYSAAYNLVRVLFKLIQSGWQALYPTLSRLRETALPEYRRVARRALQGGLGLVLIGTLSGALLAHSLISGLLGEDYWQSVLVLQILIWCAPLYLLESYVSMIFLVERQPTRSLWLIGLHLLGLLVCLPGLTLLWGATGAAWGAMLAALLTASVSLFWLRSI